MKNHSLINKVYSGLRINYPLCELESLSASHQDLYVIDLTWNNFEWSAIEVDVYLSVVLSSNPVRIVSNNPKWLISTTLRGLSIIEIEHIIGLVYNSLLSDCVDIEYYCIDQVTTDWVRCIVSKIIKLKTLINAQKWIGKILNCFRRGYSQINAWTD